MKNDGGPAFPCEYRRPLEPGEGRVKLKDATHVMAHSSGLSLRDYFASMTLRGSALLTAPQAKQIAADAYAIADAMLAEREKSNG